MKKNLLLVALAAPFFMVTAQWTQTGGTVKVMPNTTKYVSGNYEVKVAAAASNEGNVNVRGTFTAPATGDKFVNEWTDNKNYGQLIIANGQAVTGKITSKYKLAAVFPYHAMAFPFKGYTAAEAVANSQMVNPTFVGYVPGRGGYGTNSVTEDDAFDGERYKNPVFSSNNMKFQSDAPQQTEVLVATGYHSLNGHTSTLPRANALSFKGVPNNVDFTESATTSTAYPATMNSGDRNQYGETYSSYLDDPVDTAPVNWHKYEVDDSGNVTVASVQTTGYGLNVYYYGNPYTSNIDLKPSLTVAGNNVTHMFQYNANTYDNNTLLTSTGISMVTGNGTGDAASYQVRPFHAFGVKTSGGVPATLKFTEANKTFDAATTAVSYSRMNNGVFYQLGMDLYDTEDVYTGNRFYVVASDKYEAAKTGEGIEANNNYFAKTGFYSLQENEDGTIAEEFANDKVYINGVNATKYVGKPIRLVFNAVQEGTFKLKSRLSEELLSSGNKFYFEDKEEGIIMEVTPDFDYTFAVKGTEKERFVMYWNSTPDQMSTEDVSLKNNTIVYKDGRDFKVRFSNNWKQADVYVYNMVGQLVHVAKKVNTTNDYVLPINGNPAAYVVKTVGDNGEQSTNKIVK